jgi:UDPglucose 6-dehydrogenase
LDPRIAPGFLNAGLGWGGSCFPKDLKALQAFCKKIGHDSHLIEATFEVNSNQPLKAVEFAKRALGSLDNKRIAVLGLSFKPDTDDMRDAVSVKIVSGFLKEGASVIAYDPAAVEQAKRIFGERIQFASNVSDCLKGSDLAVLVTEWDEFKKLRPKDFLAQMKTPIVYDGRRIYNPFEMWDAGVKFGAVGLGPT